jgi:hypothetical protein
MREDHQLTKTKAKLGALPKDCRIISQSGSITPFLQVAEEELSPEDAVLRFIVQTNQSFALCNHPAFHGLYKSMGKVCSFNDRTTFRRYGKTRFNAIRKEQAQLLEETCQSIAISFDGWGSRNHKHIIGGIGYWIGPDWQRYSMNVEFAEAVYGKSGEGMAEVLYTSFGDNINEVETIETAKGPVEQTTTHIGLKIAHKIIAVCGDNASNNDTFCDHFHAKLLANNYDDNPQSNLGLSRCLFQGRASRIRCLAHICKLIAESVFGHFHPGTREEAQALV